MKVRIKDICTCCGLCVDNCPGAFEMDWDIAHLIVDEVPPKLQESVQHAADECPVEAIIVIKKPTF
ncbi:MAG: ferredoxin [Planctomycetota bacterium]|jgi:ferredoxin